MPFGLPCKGGCQAVTVPTGSSATPDYDSFAAAYAAQNEKGLFNAWYNKPELLRLAGDVTGTALP